MSQVDENISTEFEYTEEEKAELARLDQMNEHSNELVDELSDEQKLANDVLDALKKTDPLDEIELDDDFVDHLLGDPKAAPVIEPVVDQNLEVKIDPVVEPEPAPDYQEQLEEVEQRVTEAKGNVDDTLDKLRELAEEYDNGEVSQGKYDIEKIKLERDLRKGERLLENVESEQISLQSEADTKIAAYQDVRRTEWQNNLIGFLEDPANAIIANNTHVAEQFDILLASMGQSGVFDGLDNSQILTSVRNQLCFRVPELNATAYIPSKEQAKQKPDKPKHSNVAVPLSLSQMQAKEAPADDKFSYIRKLSGVAYEEALSKLTEEQENEFYFS